MMHPTRTVSRQLPRRDIRCSRCIAPLPRGLCSDISSRICSGSRRGLETGTSGLRERVRLEGVDESKDTIGGELEIGEMGWSDPDAVVGWVPAVCRGMVRLMGDEVRFRVDKSRSEDAKMVGGVEICDGSVSKRVKGRNVSIGYRGSIPGVCCSWKLMSTCDRQFLELL